MGFQQNLKQLERELSDSMKQKPQKRFSFMNHDRRIQNAYTSVRSSLWETAAVFGPKHEKRMKELIDLVLGIDPEEKEKALEKVRKAQMMSADLSTDTDSGALKLPKFNLPSAICDEVRADLAEMMSCHENRNYRSAVILCGRVLETCLFRKYFEVTGKDLLVTSPGLGLGKLIAKLSEANFKFDPGLSQQVHLINQVRIGSVHTKSDVFRPSGEQAHAIMLFTFDAVKKLF
ncbi:hypothetical protein JW968_03550 [Candidatus Woesearchaeota archaeon]|nr:hypothetical protein [Candidatus Woesearchaeota archaeon]